MRLVTRAVVGAVIVLGLASCPAQAAWMKHVISDILRARRHGEPCAGRSGVAWVAGHSSLQALALWDRSDTALVSGALVPRTPGGMVRPLMASPVGYGFASPSLSQGAIAFSDLGTPSGGDEVYLWDGTRVHRITYNDIPDGHPSLFGGNMVWDNYPAACSPWPCTPDDSEIWFWNGYGAWQVSDNDIDDAYPSLYELTMAWQSEGNVVYATIPDPEWGRPLAPTVVAQGWTPSLFKGEIAYFASDGNDTEIFLYDIGSRQTRQLTENAYDDVAPCLYDGTIVWEGDDGNDLEVFYWDGKCIEQLTDNEIDDTEPTLWGTGLNTTIAYVERWWDGALGSRIVCLRPAVKVSARSGDGEMVVTWPSLEGRSYRVEYSDDLVNWRVAAESVPSAGYGETSWTDREGSGTVPPPSQVPHRFYRVCEKE